MIKPATKAAKPIEADCTAELSVMNVPRKRGSTAEEIMAMPGIMRPLITVNSKVEIASKPHSGKPSDKVVATSGKATATAKRWNTRTLPTRSVSRPKYRALSKVATPPHK
jgi:hypothetical protein